MSTYSVADFDRKMDELLDKMGSDYFPLPIKLSRFQTVVLQHIRETTSFFEATQELSDDLVAISTSIPISLGQGKNFVYMAKKFYQAKYPEDYMRFLNINPYSEKNGVPQYGNSYEIKYYRIGHFAANERNPFRTATGETINVYRMDNSVLIDTDKTFTHVSFTYIKEPVIGQNPDDEILNFTDLIVDRLMQKTAVHLRATTSDQDAAFLDDYVERQGQKTK